jgi:hypothetical protein
MADGTLHHEEVCVRPAALWWHCIMRRRATAVHIRCGCCGMEKEKKE